MRRILVFSFAIYLLSCSSDNGSEVVIDCSESDLEINIENLIQPGCQKKGSFSILASGGEPPYTYRLGDNEFLDNFTFNGLDAGDYVVAIRDSQGCERTEDLSLSSPDAISISITSSGCGDNDGQIVVQASGGDGNYQYQLNQNEPTDSPEFTGLSTGQYIVKVTDGNGCSTTSDVIKIGVSLSADILPIINQNCATSGCHLNSQSPLLNSNSAIIAASGRILSRTERGTMPPSGKLPDAQIELIRNWVECGSLDN